MDATSDDFQRARARVRSVLAGLGATPGEIDQAEADGSLDLLIVDRTLFPPGARYTQDELSEQTDLPLDLLRRLWRALGFLDVEEDERVFTELDLEAARIFGDLLRTGVIEVEPALQLARVIGSSMARIAEAEVLPRVLNIAAGEDPIVAADSFAGLVGPALPALARVLEFVWRRHLQAATRRTMVLRAHGQIEGASPVLAVGFADMVGFTLISQQLSDDQLARMVSRFEEISHDTVTGLGGHVVKMIGDEVMFVVDGVLPAARIGLELAEAYADDDVLSDVRVGLAVGTVLTIEGDYFGPTVNMAHRIVKVANPGTVVISEQFHATLEAQAGEEFRAEPLRPRMLKDIGRARLWWLGRPDQELHGASASTDFDRQSRWERMLEVLRDLEELRETGEQAMVSGLRSAINRPKRSLPGQADRDHAVGTEDHAALKGLDRAAPQVDDPP